MHSEIERSRSLANGNPLGELAPVTHLVVEDVVLGDGHHILLDSSDHLTTENVDGEGCWCTKYIQCTHAYGIAIICLMVHLYT